jgi:hypothetical protein
MKIIELNQRLDINENEKLSKTYLQFERLLKELRDRELPKEIIDFINSNIEGLNLIPSSEKRLKAQIVKRQSKIIRQVEKELKIVPKNYYRNTWLAIGMSVFGIPLGVVLGTSLNNMGLIGIGLPIGMVIGLVVGSGMDKKAFEEGRQLDLEIKH